MPAWVTIVGVSLSVMPMNPTLAPWKFLIQYGGRIVSPVSAYLTLAARIWKSAPVKDLPPGQESWLSLPSPSSMQPPVASRWSSR